MVFYQKTLGLKSLFLVILISSSFTWAQSGFKTKSDSISFYLLKSKDTSSLSDSRLIFAKKAKNIALQMELDSLVVQSDLSLADIYLDTGFNEDFLNISHDNLKLSEKINENDASASINKKLGDYYYYLNLTDSAYFFYNKSLKLYRSLNDKFNTAVLLLDVAIIQKDEKDFTGSEVNSIEGVSILESLKNTNEVNRKKMYHYNNLGLVFDQLEQYDESEKYLIKVLELLKDLDGDNEYLLNVYNNNLGLTYKHSKQYDLAMSIYEQILKNVDFFTQDPEFYSLVQDNYAHTLFLSNQHEQLPRLYTQALKAIDTIKPTVYPSIAIHQHLAEYYFAYQKIDSAKYYAYKAKEISKKYHNDDLLKSLLLLSRIEDDSIAVKYYDAYIKLNDSLQKNERKIRNKFTRIRFETKQIEEQNAQIIREKFWLMLLSGILIITGLLLYVIVTQRNKNKELEFIQQQQQANEEIYNLMLSQQDKIEETRIIEKKRVSQELHDGVLGRLFGTRLSLDSLNMSSTVEAIKTRGQYIEGLKIIEDDIRKVSHELNTDFISGSGFIDIIKTLVETQTEFYNLQYKLNSDDTINWDDVSNKSKIHVYRIVQESLHNIYKHAQASLMHISFELKNDVICLSINDNGVGFVVDKAKKGIGVKNMNSRIDEIEGTLHIESEKDKGTTIIITIPT